MAKWRHFPKTSAPPTAPLPAAQETFAEPQALTRTYRLPIGELPGTTFIELRTMGLLAHAWDLAIATGQPTDLDSELAEYVLAFSKQMMSRPGLRGDGRPFGEEQPSGEERPAADRARPSSAASCAEGEINSRLTPE